MASAGRVPLMVGNWKMNLDHVQATHLVQKLDWTLKDGKHDYAAVEVAVLPPFTALRTVQTLIEGDRLELQHGAQDLSPEEVDGAFTGDISGSMLARLGCRYVLAGHSERREHHNEDDALVGAKVRAAYHHRLTPILCVGENLDVRQAGNQVTHCIEQLLSAVDELTSDQVSTIVVAYEPVWAIGTGEVATPEDAQEVCAALRARLAERFAPEVADAVRLLYGGSVKAANIASIMAGPDVDGALVGGASLKADEFAGICRYRDHVGT